MAMLFQVVSFVLAFDIAVASASVVFHCKEPNDLLAAVNARAAAPQRCEATLSEAVAKAPAGALVLSLAPGYPSAQTELLGTEPETALRQAAAKGLSLYVEFPSAKPGAAARSPISSTRWERAVVSSGALEPALAPLRLLNAHMVNYTDLGEAAAASADLVLAKVAGYDVASFGLNDTVAKPLLTWANLTGLPVLLATAQLSNFVTARFAPVAAWSAVWSRILALAPEPPNVTFSAAVRPSYGRDAGLPANAELIAHQRAVDWYLRGRVLPSPAMALALAKYRSSGGAGPVYLPVGEASGDGRLGVLEGVYSEVRAGGQQPISINVRDDCTAETAMAFALRSLQPAGAPYAAVARHLLDFAWGRGGFPQTWLSGSAVDANGDAFGLLAWSSTPDAAKLMYSDDDARALLGGLAAAAALGTSRWDSVIATAVLANLRLLGQDGIPVQSITFAELEKNGWQHYWNGQGASPQSPHYIAYIWAVHLWAFQASGYRPLLDRAKAGISTLMAGYPHKWVPTANGICMQRARMLLPLAWLVRVEDTEEHRGWLAAVAAGLLARQDASGALREELSAPGWGGSTRVPNNADYGTFEAPLNQENADPVSDLLYTSNFALLGLHEAAAATGNATYARAAAALAAFLVRAQASSPEAHPELDGAFFRAFDLSKWEVWASDADIGWGAWSVETGWTQSWISTVLGLRSLNTSLWSLYEGFEGSTLRDEILGWAPYFFPQEEQPAAGAVFV